IGAISRAGPRRRQWPLGDVFAANVHVDLVDWAHGRGFVGEEVAVDRLVGHLRGRPLRVFRRAGPTGMMPHHRVPDAAAEKFVDRLLGITLARSAARWLAAGEVFAPGIAGSA